MSGPTHATICYTINKAQSQSFLILATIKYPLRILGFIISAAVTLGLVIALNSGMGMVPPLGPFLSPFTGFWQNAETSEITYNSQVKITGLREDVHVVLDNKRIPHIVAKNEEDLYFMQGYVTARDRLWQMEFIYYAASGKVSELVGDRALEFDRTQRRLGIPFAAKNATELISTDHIAESVLKAYCAGVNAYINQLAYKELPVEYKLLNYQPQPWTPYHCAILLKFMAKMLTGNDYDFEFTNALNLLGRETFDILYPDFPNGIDPVIPAGTPYTSSIPSAKDSFQFNSDTPLSSSPYEKPPENIGSNNWAVAPDKSTTGFPILCNDPHLGLRIPAIWYQLQLQSPAFNVYGVSIPGAPGITIGFNNKIAWGVTNAGGDVKDWYHIQYKDQDRDEYLFDDKWMSVNKVIEEIKIKDKQTFYDTVAYTHFGPVTYDQSFQYNGSSNAMALRWTAHDPSNELRTFYLLNRAANYNDYLEALNYYECPGQNFAFASIDGDIAIKQQGKFVNKSKEQGKFVQDGTRSSSQWQGFIPFEHNPHVLNPERGFVSSANQHPTDTTYPYYYNGIYEYYRNRRINNILSEKDKFSPDDLKTLQNDNYNLMASEILPYLLTHLDVSDLDNIAQRGFDDLANWNYYNDKELTAPSLFELFWNNFYELLWDEFSGENKNIYTPPNYYATINFMINYPDHHLIDYQSTPEKESLKDIINMAFKNGVAALHHWADSSSLETNWASYKGTRLEHWALIKPFYVRDLNIGGNKHIVNATSKTHGASWRMVVALGEEINAWGIYPGGQSGNPGSPFYDDFTNTWADGEYYPLFFMTDDKTNDERIIFTQSFNPK